MRVAAEPAADIVGQNPDVGALRHTHVNDGLIPLKGQKREAFDLNLTGLTLHFNTLAGEIIKVFSAVLDGRVHRRHLFDDAGEFPENLYEFVFCRTFATAFRHRTGFIHRIGGGAERELSLIALVGVQQV